MGELLDKVLGINTLLAVTIATILTLLLTSISLQNTYLVVCYAVILTLLLVFYLVIMFLKHKDLIPKNGDNSLFGG